VTLEIQTERASPTRRRSSMSRSPSKPSRINISVTKNQSTSVITVPSPALHRARRRRCRAAGLSPTGCERVHLGQTSRRREVLDFKPEGSSLVDLALEGPLVARRHDWVLAKVIWQGSDIELAPGPRRGAQGHRNGVTVPIARFDEMKHRGLNSRTSRRREVSNLRRRSDIVGLVVAIAHEIGIGDDQAVVAPPARREHQARASGAR
jgi:hypothetical protein